MICQYINYDCAFCASLWLNNAVILDTLKNADCYAALHTGFAAAFDFLKNQDLATLPAGRCDVLGNRVFAIVGRDQGKGRDKARLEAHRQYIDIQFVVSGDEWIGWRDLKTCRETGLGYDEQKEIEFYTAAPVKWFRVPPGSFAIFFPDDVHAPLAGEGSVHKVVVKVAVAG
jgi:biofilm protein TabA